MIIRLLLISSLALPVYAEEKSWRAKMNELSVAMSEAITYLFPDPNRDVKGLGEKIKKIHEITNGLDVMSDHVRKAKDFDPALPYLAAMFKEDIERADAAMQEGNVDYAKAVLRSSTAYCIACHTRTKGGAEFPLIAAYADPLKTASWINKIEFMTASRQFDSVLSQVTTALTSEAKPGVNALDLERATRLALSVAVRVKNDPAKARALARAVTRSPIASFSLKEGAKVWEDDIRLWEKERSKKYGKDVDLLNAAKALVDQALKSKDPIGGHDEVKYLRASMLMHDLLKNFPDSKLHGEALYVIGMSYRTIQDLGVWSLHDKYFQACIDAQPHSTLAERCFKEYETSVVLGYSGSSGVHVPGSIKRHLERLSQKAKVQ